ncbi:MAG: SsrA-binding protein SmpB [Mariprofundales bacterium]|nr:SsrA-binding protein SmpB [Mariprofundales bacterium]
MLNRKARYEYHILETMEAGIMLLGPEVKSLRAGLGNLTESHCIVRNGQVELVGCYINPYRPAATNNHPDPARTRRLLLHKQQITRLIGKLKEKGVTLIPLKLYFNERGIAKLEIALGRGKKMHDKRQAIKERDIRRDLQRNYKTG